MAVEEPDEEEDEEPAKAPGTDSADEVGLRVWLFLLLVAAGLALLAYRSYPSHHPLKSDPSFIDSIFANNLVLFAARLVLFSAAFVLAVTAIYVVWSMIKGMLAGQVLSKFGPFEMQAVQDLSGDVEMWQNLWSESNNEADQLRERLEETDNLFGQLYDAYQQLLAEREQEHADRPPTS